jgi:energy-coupling factor transporter transmembrane protein EcfT
LPEIHPLVRVVTLLLFIAGISLARPTFLMAGLILLAGIYLLSGFPAMGKLMGMLKRLRWLMLAIVLVCGWWTPGVPLFPGHGMLSPTLEGVQLGFIRLLVLTIIVAAVHLLLQRTGREQLLAALMQLFTPLSSRQGRERIAVRIVLSMEAVTQIQPLLQNTLSGHSVVSRGLSGLGNAAADVYGTVLDTVDRIKCDSITVVEAPRPAPWQWFIPLVLVAGIVLLF